MPITSALSRHWTPYVISSIWQASQYQNPPEWRPSNIYTQGQQVTSNGYVFISRNGGKSGRTAPSFLQGSTTFKDGTIEWIRSRTAVEALDYTSNLYLSIGAVGNIEAEPETPELSDKENQAIKDRVINLFRVQRRNLSFGIKLTPYTSRIFTRYDGTDAANTDLSYVVTNGEDRRKHIFKCIDNALGIPSTVAPSTIDTNLESTPDGYVWKYMASVSGIDLDNFATAEYVPVRAQNAEGTDQWDVQQNAKRGEISSFFKPNTGYEGSGTLNEDPEYTFVGKDPLPDNVLDALVVVRLDAGVPDYISLGTSPGANYPKDTWVVIGDPDSITSYTANIDVDGEVESFNSPPSGLDDETTKVFIIGDGEGAKFTVSSGALTPVVVSTVEQRGTGYTWARAIVIPSGPAYIAKAIMAPPLGHGKNIIDELKIDTLLFSFRINDADYDDDNPIVSGTEFNQVGIVSGAQPLPGSTTNASAYLGPAHENYSTSLLSKYDPQTGYLLYVNNTQKITHYEGREELFKIAITF